MLALLALFLACTPATKDDTSAGVDTSADTSAGDTSEPSDDTSDTGDTSGTDTSDTSDSSDSGGDTAAFDLSTCDGGHDDPTPQAPDCAEAGGICVANGQCGGGTHLDALDADCSFDDGPGECCVPPESAPTGETCADKGGVCSPIAGCGMVDGWYANSTDCTGVNNICCVPEETCAGQEDVACCYRDERGVPTTQFEAACNRGALECPFEGITLECVEDCPV